MDRRCLCILPAFLILPLAAAELPPEIRHLSMVKRRMAANLAALPSYACLETIERAARDSSSKPFRTLDTVRLEVGVSGEAELFSWPGSRRFAEGGATGLIEGGLTGSGTFASHLRAIFIHQTASVTFAGEENHAGRPAFRFDYSIPRSLSGWTIEQPGRGDRVGSKGVFWTDAVTYDLLELRIAAAEIPATSPAIAASVAIDYARIPVDGSDDPGFLLPRFAEILVAWRSGQESRNRAEIVSCRRFQSGSRLLPAEPPAAPAPAPEIEEFQVPAGILLPVSIDRPVDWRFAVGDPLTATVEADVVHHSHVLIPKGATVRGRVTRLERDPSPPGSALVSLEFDEITFGNRRAILAARIESVRPPAGLRAVAAGSGVFVEGRDFRLPGGLEMLCRSLPPKP